VIENVSPWLSDGLVGVASGLVSLMSWMLLSALVHVTVVPGFTTAV
jgi:hypothetical protein